MESNASVMLCERRAGGVSTEPGAMADMIDMLRSGGELDLEVFPLAW